MTKLVTNTAVVQLAYQKRLGLSADYDQQPCIFDLTNRAGVDVRVMPLDSIDGFFCRALPPTIFLTNRRPELRQRFTCAHELAHHFLDHGESLTLSEAVALSRMKTAEERLAQLFAGHFLMPKTLVLLLARKLDANWASIDPVTVYLMSQALGVGYQTFCTHACYSLNLISKRQCEDLHRVRLPNILAKLGVDGSSQSWCVISDCWVGRPIDVPIGGSILVSPELSIDIDASEARVTSTSDRWSRIDLLRDYPGCEVGEVDRCVIRLHNPEYSGRMLFRYLATGEQE